MCRMTFVVISFLFFINLAYAENAHWSLHEENDFFNFTNNNDRNYTQGVRITRHDSERDYFIGQHFYTPGNKQIKEVQLNDRPYAGWLYVGASERLERSATVEDLFTLQIGIVGPQAYAKETQRWVHDLLKNRQAQGWDNQLKNEPGIIFQAVRNVQHYRNSFFDIFSYFGGDLGNVFTQAKVGNQLRLGYNLPERLTENPLSPTSLKKDLSIYLYGIAESRAVARNMFLDGNLFADSHSVTKHWLVSDLGGGLAIGIDDFIISYEYIYRTAEFQEKYEPYQFGSINIRWNL